MEEYVGRKLTVEVTYGHNEGREVLKNSIEENEDTKNRVSSRSLRYQEKIEKLIEK